MGGNENRMRSMAQVCVLVFACMALSSAAVFAEDWDAPSLGGTQVALVPSTPVLLSSGQYEALVAAPGDGDRGGWMAGVLGCCVSTPFGQWENAGHKPDVGRSVLRFFLVGAIYDGYKAYQGETAEEYLRTDTLTATPPRKAGGVGAGVKACFLPGVPGGQLRNSGIDVPARAWLRMIPYLGQVVWVYDGYQAYRGETIQEYLDWDF